MPLFQLIIITNDWVTIVTCSALSILMVVQLRHDFRSRLFALLMADVALIAFTGALARFASVLGYSSTWVSIFFTIASIFTGTMPPLIFTFSAELLEMWTPWRRWTAYILVAVSSTAVILFLLNRAFISFTMAPDGYISYNLSPLVDFLLALGEIGLILTLQLTFEKYRKRPERTNNRLSIGIVIMCIGYFVIPIPAISKYVIQVIMFALSGVVMAPPILQQRLFDPLTQFNKQLTRRAEQLSIINRVGQQANAVLELSVLLNTIGTEIRQAFDYYAVTIYLLSSKNQVLEAKSAAGAFAQDYLALKIQLALDSTSLIGTAAVTRQVVNVGDVHEDRRYAKHELRSNTRSEASLPLLTGSQSTHGGASLIGVLDIQSQQRNAFSHEEIDVLKILAQQIAIAIRNAQLFEETQAARLAADDANRKKTLFLSAMSHDLRTPLQTVISRSQWMLSHPEIYAGVPLPNEYVDDVVSIEKSGKHLHSLINNILDLSKIEAGEYDLMKSKVDPVLLLREVENNYTGSLHAGVELRSQYAPQLPHIFGDDLNIKKILGNLVGNACKFTDQGAITLNAVVINSELCFSVADTGPGIPLEAQAKLFSPYSQGDHRITRDHEGTGLGLYLCKQLVALHQGRLWLESTEQQGSTFYFTIPLVSLENVSASEVIQNPSPARVVIFSKSDSVILPVQILVVAPGLDGQDQLTSVLSRADYEVVTAKTLNEGITLASALAPAQILLVTRSEGPSEMDELSRSLSKETDLVRTRILKYTMAGENLPWQGKLLALLKCASALPEVKVN